MKLIYYIWSLLERFGTNIVSLGGNIVLSYLLLREDFGLVGMLAVFSNIVFVLIDCGLSDGLLRYQNPTNREFNTLFYFNMVTSLALCLIYCAISPLIVAYFHRQELGPIMMSFGFGAILSGACISQATKLRSQLQFKKIAFFNIASVGCALVIAIIMALKGFRYWALVELQVGYSAFYLLFLILFSKWNLKFEFSINCFKKLWRFGVNLLFSTLITQISQNIFTFVLGKFYNPVQAGYMWQAQKLQQAPTNSLEMSISSTSYVLISKHHNEDDKRLEFVKMFGIYTFINSLFMFLIFAVSAPFIQAIFPQKWYECVPYLQVLLVWGLIYPVNNFMMILFKIFNLTKVIRNVLLIEKTGVVIAAFLLYPLGVYAILGAAIILSVITFIIFLVYANSLSLIKPRCLIKPLLLNICSFAAIAVATLLTNKITMYDCVNLLVGGICYIFLSLLFMKYFKHHYFQYVWSKVKQLFAPNTVN